ncbi:hypothetical protein LPTSP2_37150 [Leptospira ellinghausenii]|uniref:Uncharacterized protein n=1 Tax=Leptospira ellinghausenii TaxID=1917822 RepID=A0A2P2DID3_9LEPT|nr:hypothetical protein [Leptospira ellinghausenii]GBF44412.1 hypothetical protein LPTSP2_37150 [Leptospira ellinghausenii]
MLQTEFIIKEKGKTQEIIAFSKIESQQIDTNMKLILITFERDFFKNFGTKLLFMRVGNKEAGIYNRFRENTWYLTDDFDKKNPLHIEIYSYKEYRDRWEWLEKRINPIAITIATILSTIITITGINLNTYIEKKNGKNEIELYNNKIKELENKIEEIKKLK